MFKVVVDLGFVLLILGCLFGDVAWDLIWGIVVTCDVCVVFWLVVGFVVTIAVLVLGLLFIALDLFGLFACFGCWLVCLCFAVWVGVTMFVLVVIYDILCVVLLTGGFVCVVGCLCSWLLLLCLDVVVVYWILFWLLRFVVICLDCFRFWWIGLCWLCLGGCIA